MATIIINVLETAAIALISLLVKKYVFLEPDMEPRKQYIFYGAGFLITAGIFFLLGKDAASIAVIVLIGLNICLAREKRRLLGLLLMIPFLGIVNGLLTPILLIPPYLLSLSEQWTMVYQFAVYGVLALLLLLFLVKGRRWRAWFSANVKHRSLRISEKCLLWMIGILIFLFSIVGVRPLVTDRGDAQMPYGAEMTAFIGTGSAAAFVMTITIIVLIMQGNKRSFYHEQVSNMQSGMITFMAEVVENRDDNTGGHIKRTAGYVEGIVKELK